MLKENGIEDHNPNPTAGKAIIGLACIDRGCQWLSIVRTSRSVIQLGWTASFPANHLLFTRQIPDIASLPTAEEASIYELETSGSRTSCQG
jgi:hypothetical protein